MSWIDNTGSPMLSPSRSVFPQMDGWPGSDMGPDDPEQRDAYVDCDVPTCDEFWGVHGSGDLDGYLRSRGWSAVARPEGGMEHLCPDHAR